MNKFISICTISITDGIMAKIAIFDKGWVGGSIDFVFRSDKLWWLASHYPGVSIYTLLVWFDSMVVFDSANRFDSGVGNQRPALK